ncbi:serine hydrolase domain-containing protein [Streptomyces pristinaespiralis]|jgi:D-alanyl-D-alanine carboxypeptidase|uniref:D-alanyl-D-alanine carboxypeptidase n=2 Tax=Streptomyces pristinaespiralis TaxID=38300 RepID=B5HJX6_STRE2|nr:serine hydrolase domain-containing protein [Streptomyces pristinaespiralis]ALC18510.1 penicillin-binding protein, beta-lactamase class C [Streptomyces pristinaespiralis]ALC25455.1 penicillin-binding protein, beta-lactamase class C [Streptomyces pristinaespiralis]EDY67137.1 D-alanyl-D-alanine carboxypeptidase [Streptomyces pristinaespiralis ATCC 25486]QMU12342.1 beta-lactamase family protein [Streptomyces pristinaespiralis]CBW45658.1 putative D-alanyl-D-alanine carboxypeptidase [Streptomyces
MTQTTIDRPGVSALQEAVQGAADRLVQAGAAGVQFRVTRGDNSFVVTSGIAELGSDRPVPADGRFRISCITKPFVSVVVLQLVAEGRLDLDRTVESYLPGLLPYGEKITVRNLMQHTSGLYNYMDSFQKPGDRFLRDRYKHYEPEDLIAIAAAKPLEFEPGTKFAYCNTNYFIVGLLIKKITGRSYREEITERVLEPLGLKETTLPGDDPNIPGPHARGYMQIGGEPVDVTLMNPSEAGCAGEIISTTADLDRFFTALFSGELLNEPEFTEMTTPLPPEMIENLPMGIGYGLGIMKLENDDDLDLWGHGAGIPGYATFAATTRDRSARVQLSFTIGDKDFGPEAEQAVIRGVNTALCS